MDDSDIHKVAIALLDIYIIFGGPPDKVSLASGVRLNNALLNVASGTITIGENTFCGHNVCFLTGSHPLEGVRQNTVPDGHDIVVGQNVWLASNVTVIGPCTIGDDCVIAAGAVVTKDCEPGWVYGGVPAKKIRKVV